MPLFAMTWLRSGGAYPVLTLAYTERLLSNVLVSATLGVNCAPNDFFASVVVSNSTLLFSMFRVAKSLLFRLPPTVATQAPGNVKLHSVNSELFTAKFWLALGRSTYGGAGMMNTPLLVLFDCWTVAPSAPVTPITSH